MNKCWGPLMQTYEDYNKGNNMNVETNPINTDMVAAHAAIEAGTDAEWRDTVSECSIPDLPLDLKRATPAEGKEIPLAVTKLYVQTEAEVGPSTVN